MGYRPIAADHPDRFRVRVEQYVAYHRDGFLKVPGLLRKQDIRRLLAFTESVLEGSIDVPGALAPPPDATVDELMQRFTRIHMLHRTHCEAEWGLLHPRVLDVLEALVGPDVLALQSMLFFNPPGRGGQGWHQDAYYITTYPDTLIGAWIALEPADEENGCLWVAPGSHHEPIYPPVESAGYSPGLVHAKGAIDDLPPAENTSSLDDLANALTPVAERYAPWRPSPMEPGDVLFFHSHLLHRSHPNRSAARMRRAYVTHYCNARSWVPWNHGAPFDGDSANAMHILARGATHLPYADPAFGTPVLLASPVNAAAPARMMPMPGGDMEVVSGPDRM